VAGHLAKGKLASRRGQVPRNGKMSDTKFVSMLERKKAKNLISRYVDESIKFKVAYRNESYVLVEVLDQADWSKANRLSLEIGCET
jgi:hypothetical protein